MTSPRRSRYGREIKTPVTYTPETNLCSDDHDTPAIVTDEHMDMILGHAKQNGVAFDFDAVVSIIDELGLPYSVDDPDVMGEIEEMVMQVYKDILEEGQSCGDDKYEDCDDSMSDQSASFVPSEYSSGSSSDDSSSEEDMSDVDSDGSCD